MAVNQNNEHRVIISNPTPVGPNWEFTMTTDNTELTGLLKVGVFFNDVTSEVDVYATAFAEAEKEEYVNGDYGFKLGDLGFFAMVDGGVGLDIAQTIDLGVNYDHDKAAFLGNKRIEIITLLSV